MEKKFLKKVSVLLSACLLCGSITVTPVTAAETTAKLEIPKSEDVISIIKKANDFWIKNNPDPGAVSPYTNERNNPAQGWALSVYFIGNMAAYEATQDKTYLDYALKWADKYKWSPLNDPLTKNPDSQCCMTTYYMLSKIVPDKADLTKTKANMESCLNDSNNRYFSWVDTLYMIAPLYAMMYQDTKDERYLTKLDALYKDCAIDRQFYDESEGLWYRDAKFFYPAYKSKNGKKDFWGRGNGWGYAATARILEYLPDDAPNRQMYMDIFQQQSLALKEIQDKEDGLWRASLLDPEAFPNIEMSGSSLFIYGLALGVNHGWLDESYRDVVIKAWNGAVEYAVAEDGRIGWAQPGGDRANSTTFERTNCFTTGAFLSAANEMSKMEKNPIWDGAKTDISVLVDGMTPKFDAKPQIQDGRTLVPMRAIFETLGADIKWDDKTKTVTGTKDKNTVKLTINSNKATVAGKETTLEVPAQLIDDRTFVPLRFIAESLDAVVDWYDNTKTIVITSKPAPLTHDKEMKTETPANNNNTTTTPSTTTPAAKPGTSTATAAPKAEATDFGKRVTSNAKVADIKSPKLTPKTVAGTLDASPGEASNSPDKAADGKLDTRWACRSTNGSAWIEYEFDAVKKIDALSIAFYKGNERSTAFDIYVSADGKAWTKVLAAKGSGSTTELEGFTFNAVDAKYVRLLGWGANNGANDWNSVTEMNVYGK